MEKIKVSSWNDGKHDSRGKGYGIRVGKNNRFLFDKNWKRIELSVEGKDFFEVSITSGFWRNCPEFRDERIGRWFYENNFAPWNKGETPKFSLTKINERKFRLDKI